MFLLALLACLLLGEGIDNALQTNTVVDLILGEGLVFLHLFFLGLKHCSELMLQLAQPLILRPIFIY